MNKQHDIKHDIKKDSKKEGSLYVSISCALIFLTIFMGIVLQQVLLFTSFVRKKQEYMTHFYAADALAQYGAAYGMKHYFHFMDLGANFQEIKLPFEHWPEQSSSYAGLITIKKDQNNLINNLIIEAELSQQGACIQRILCTISPAAAPATSQPAGRQFHITRWRQQ